MCTASDSSYSASSPAFAAAWAARAAAIAFGTEAAGLQQRRSEYGRALSEVLQLSIEPFLTSA